MTITIKFKTLSTAVLVFGAAAFLSPIANAGNHLVPPGIQPCFNPGGCGPAGGGGGGGGGGAGGGGLGPFGQGIATGIGAGIGLGIVNGLSQPSQPQVIYQQQPVYVQPAPMPVGPAPQPVSGGLSAHDQFCLGKYKSYNVGTKRYLSYSGQYKVCVSPYM